MTRPQLELEMLRDDLSAAVSQAMAGACMALGLEQDAMPQPELHRSADAGHGDYTTSVAFKMARGARRPPLEVAKLIADRFSCPGVSASSAGAGYVNLTISRDDLMRRLPEMARTERYGANNQGSGSRVQVEFLSSNPTGPLHVANLRGGVLGDCLSRLLAFSGYDVTREFYINDYGSQLKLFGQSILARAEQLTGRAVEVPEGGYQGAYVGEIARAALEQHPQLTVMAADDAVSLLTDFGIQTVLGWIRRDLEAADVHFEVWFSESSLWRDGLGRQTLDLLEGSGHLCQRDGAVWFRPSPESPDDDQSVVIRSNGDPTYFASDLAYLRNKFGIRGFDKVIMVLGADHHGWSQRVRGALPALGIVPERFEVILTQMVHLVDNGEVRKMSKRAGTFETASELIGAVGADAVRYFYLMRSADSTMEFDLDLALRRSSDNPVYYAQYAHARLCQMEQRAASQAVAEIPDMSSLDHPLEVELARQLIAWPEVVWDACAALEPHRIPHFINRLADHLHRYYQVGARNPELRVLGQDPEVTAARLELVRACRKILCEALNLIGVSAPEHM